MEKPEYHSKSRVSKWAAGLSALSLVAGLTWTAGSGLTNVPEKIVSSQSRVQMAIPFRGLCRDLTIHSEGEQLTIESPDIRGGLARFSVQLRPGEHDLNLTFSGLIPGLDSNHTVRVVVDRVPPELQAKSGERSFGAETLFTTEPSLSVSGVTEPQASLTVESQVVSVAQNGSFQHEVELQPGWNHLLLSSIDEAGNESKLKQSVFFDSQEPELKWKTTPDQVFDKNTARLELSLSDDGAIRGISGKVDGKYPITWHAKGSDLWVGTTPELHEGFHEVTVKAADVSGRAISSKRQIVIDSTEVLGDAVLGLGARGEDVKLLHERLADAGFLGKAPLGSVFNKATEQAIRKLQESEGFEETGRAEGKTLVALGPRIFINLSSFSLVLDRPGKEQRRWMIASGSPAHPTPTGNFRIVEKVYNPTWLPPKSDWAKDAKPIPPGPGNPLGTRWLGFDWGAVGIHGTNAPWSVGTASSHGCMRMVTGQVEELFELVEVGTPVVVLGGWEQNPVLDKYWPIEKPSVEASADEKTKEVAET